MISKEEVLKIAKLARLELTGEEVEKMQKDLSAILDYFTLLKKVDTSSIEKVLPASATPKALQAGTRKDEVLLQEVGANEKLISSAPDRKDDYVKVKAIL